MPPFNFDITAPLVETVDRRASNAAIGAQVGKETSLVGNFLEGIGKGLDLREQYERINATYGPEKLAAEQLKRQLENQKIEKEMKRIEAEAKLKNQQAQTQPAESAALVNQRNASATSSLSTAAKNKAEIPAQNFQRETAALKNLSDVQKNSADGTGADDISFGASPSSSPSTIPEVNIPAAAAEAQKRFQQAQGSNNLKDINAASQQFTVQRDDANRANASFDQSDKLESVLQSANEKIQQYGDDDSPVNAVSALAELDAVGKTVGTSVANNKNVAEFRKEIFSKYNAATLLTSVDQQLEAGQITPEYATGRKKIINSQSAYSADVPGALSPDQEYIMAAGLPQKYAEDPDTVYQKIGNLISGNPAEVGDLKMSAMFLSDPLIIGARNASNKGTSVFTMDTDGVTQDAPGDTGGKTAATMVQFKNAEGTVVGTAPAPPVGDTAAAARYNLVAAWAHKNNAQVAQKQQARAEGQAQVQGAQQISKDIADAKPPVQPTATVTNLDTPAEASSYGAPNQPATEQPAPPPSRPQFTMEKSADGSSVRFRFPKDGITLITDTSTADEIGAGPDPQKIVRYITKEMGGGKQADITARQMVRDFDTYMQKPKVVDKVTPVDTSAAQRLTDESQWLLDYAQRTGNQDLFTLTGETRAEISKANPHNDPTRATIISEMQRISQQEFVALLQSGVGQRLADTETERRAWGNLFFGPGKTAEALQGLLNSRRASVKRHDNLNKLKEVLLSNGALNRPASVVSVITNYANSPASWKELPNENPLDSGKGKENFQNLDYRDPMTWLKERNGDAPKGGGSGGNSPSPQGGGGSGSGSPTAGMTTPGNIDLNNRPVVNNSDGSISTVRSMSTNIDGKEVLLPTVSDNGRIMSNQEAINQYKKTGKHLGIFDSPQAATEYAQSLHTQQAAKYLAPKLAASIPPDQQTPQTEKDAAETSHMLSDFMKLAADNNPFYRTEKYEERAKKDPEFRKKVDNAKQEISKFAMTMTPGEKPVDQMVFKGRALSGMAFGVGDDIAGAFAGAANLISNSLGATSFADKIAATQLAYNELDKEWGDENPWKAMAADVPGFLIGENLVKKVGIAALAQASKIPVIGELAAKILPAANATTIAEIKGLPTYQRLVRWVGQATADGIAGAMLSKSGDPVKDAENMAAVSLVVQPLFHGAGSIIGSFMNRFVRTSPINTLSRLLKKSGVDIKVDPDVIQKSIESWSKEISTSNPKAELLPHLPLEIRQVLEAPEFKSEVKALSEKMRQDLLKNVDQGLKQGEKAAFEVPTGRKQLTGERAGEEASKRLDTELQADEQSLLQQEQVAARQTGEAPIKEMEAKGAADEAAGRQGVQDLESDSRISAAEAEQSSAAYQQSVSKLSDEAAASSRNAVTDLHEQANKILPKKAEKVAYEEPPAPTEKPRTPFKAASNQIAHNISELRKVKTPLWKKIEAIFPKMRSQEGVDLLKSVFDRLPADIQNNERIVKAMDTALNKIQGSKNAGPNSFRALDAIRQEVSKLRGDSLTRDSADEAIKIIVDEVNNVVKSAAETSKTPYTDLISTYKNAVNLETELAGKQKFFDAAHNAELGQPGSGLKPNQSTFGKIDKYFSSDGADAFKTQIKDVAELSKQSSTAAKRSTAAASEAEALAQNIDEKAVATAEKVAQARKALDDKITSMTSPKAKSQYESLRKVVSDPREFGKRLLTMQPEELTKLVKIPDLNKYAVDAVLDAVKELPASDSAIAAIESGSGRSKALYELAGLDKNQMKNLGLILKSEFGAQGASAQISKVINFFNSKVNREVLAQMARVSKKDTGSGGNQLIEQSARNAPSSGLRAAIGALQSTMRSGMRSAAKKRIINELFTAAPAKQTAAYWKGVEQWLKTEMPVPLKDIPPEYQQIFKEHGLAQIYDTLSPFLASAARYGAMKDSTVQEISSGIVADPGDAAMIGAYDIGHGIMHRRERD